METASQKETDSTAGKPAFCHECGDTGLLNHADVAAYWDAADAAVSGWKDEGLRSRGMGPGPVEEPCLDCPVCGQCGFPVSEHDAEVLATARPEEGSRHFWVIPDCVPVHDARGHLVPAVRGKR